MILGEPPRTQYDLQFQIAGIPARIHPLFWLAALVLGHRLGEPLLLLIWVGVLLVSILVHELGHAFAMRYYGLSARVVLYMLGGLAIPGSSGHSSSYDPGQAWGQSSKQRQPGHWIAISAAGPAAGFLLAGLVVVVIFATGGQFWLEPSFPLFWGFELGEGYRNLELLNLVHFLLLVNIFWGLINLMPVYPLDGGQIAREMLVSRDPWHGVERSLQVSLYTGGAMVLVAIYLGSLYIGVMFGLLAYSSYSMLQQGGGRPW